jgi:hypothetical protein
LDQILGVTSPELFQSGAHVIEKAQEVEEAGNSLNLKELHASLEEADANTKCGQ